MAALYRFESSSSQGDWSEQQDSSLFSLLPYELAVHILDFVPPRELLRVCMLVSRGWYGLLSDPTFWKVKMKRAGNYSGELDSVLSASDWPKLFLYTVSEPNFIKSFDRERKLDLFSHWKLSSTDWERFKVSSREAAWNSGGGNHWIVEKKEFINPETDADLVEENNGSVDNYATSYGWCCREQVVRLADVGLTDKIMDEIQPDIEVSEWFCARFDCGSLFCIRVELLAEREGKAVDSFERSEKTDQWQGGELGWRKVQHIFRQYGPGARYIRFADAGKDTQYWAGHYGSKMAAAWARVQFTQT